jgi:hypothetical protein
MRLDLLSQFRTLAAQSQNLRAVSERGGTFDSFC